MKLSKIIPITVAVLIIGGAVAARIISNKEASAGGRRQMTPLVKIELPQIETVTTELKLYGDILPIQQAGIVPKVGGTLERIYVNVGDHVGEGRLLAQIDTTELKQQFLQAAATQQNARQTFERAQNLSAEKLISQQELDNARTTLQIADANYESARLRLAYASLTAPFRGVITRRLLDPGAIVSANSSLIFTLMDIATVKVVVQVNEKDVPAVTRGKPATVRVDAYPGEKFTGKVERLGESLDLATRTMPVEVHLPNADNRLKPGMFATVTLELDSRPDALTIPSGALQKSQTGYSVYVVQSGVAKRRNVDVGVETGDRSEILSGLSLGDSIIVAGMQTLSDNSKVNISR